MYRNGHSGVVTWSPCNRFIAVAIHGAVELRDGATLNLLSTFESPSHSEVKLLSFPPDGHILTQLNRRGLLTWDLETGGSVYTILPDTLDVGLSYLQSLYSMGGRILTVLSQDLPSESITITTYYLSTSHTHHHRVSEGRIISPAWTRGEFLQFAAAETGCITIWEVESTFTHEPEMVESLPLSEEIAKIEAFELSLFLPTLYRLAVILENTLLIWDARCFKLFLNLSPFLAYNLSFSPNGCFFACAIGSAEVGVWKEDPLAGYILHQKLTFASFIRYGVPLFSPNGKSVVISTDSKIYLWHTGDPILSSGSTPVWGSFIPAFSPNEALVAFARHLGNTVVIIDLQSGGSQLTINTGVWVWGLGVAGSTLAVVDWRLSIGTWQRGAAEQTSTTAFGPHHLTLQRTVEARSSGC